MTDNRVSPIWFYDPSDDSRYGAAVDGKCPADGTLLSGAEQEVTVTHCETCRRVFYREDGRRVARCWWSGQKGLPDPSKEELRHLLVAMLRAARPHPTEHPTMWRVWGEVCERIGLNAGDYRIPTARKDS